MAADTLNRMGYGRVAYLDGGLRAWREAGQPVMRP
jgi:rhodanese-related sulfurtransferase